MKSFIPVAAVVMLLWSAMVATSAPLSDDPAIDAIMTGAKAQNDKITVMENAELDPVRTLFLRQLQQVREAPQVRANADALMELELVSKAVKDGAPLPVTKTTTTLFQGFASNYDRGMSGIAKKYDAMRARLEADFQTAMADLERRYAQATKMDAATKVRTIRQNGLPAGGSFAGEAVDVLPTMVGTSQRVDEFVVVNTPSGIATPETYPAPIEIIYELKNDNQVRFAYGADVIIFNWERKRSELRIDGGPASGQHRPGKGEIPVGSMLTIRQVVLPKKMTIWVNGEERATWEGDFSRVNQAIRVFARSDAINLKQILVRKLR